MARVIATETRVEPYGPPYKSAEQMEKLCCEPTDAMQCREEVELQWAGYDVQEVADDLGLSLDANGRDSQGRYVEVRLSPRSKPCGEKVTRYDWSGKNCCDLVEPLSFDRDASAEVLPAGGSVLLVADGGEPPFLWRTTNGYTFFQSPGSKQVVTTSRAVMLSASELFCGITGVSVQDKCSVASMEVRADQGEWIERTGLQNACRAEYVGTTAAYASTGGTGYWLATGINGRWKVLEYQGVVSGIDGAALSFRGVGVNNGPSWVGTCDDGYMCAPCPPYCTLSQALVAAFEGCEPGAYASQHPDSVPMYPTGLVSGDWTCLQPGFPPGYVLDGHRADIESGPYKRSWVAQYALQGEYYCGGVSSASRYAKRYVSHATGLRVFEWVC